MFSCYWKSRKSGNLGESFGTPISNTSIPYPNRMKKLFLFATLISIVNIVKMDFSNLSELDYLVIASALLMWGVGINLYRKERK